MFARNSCISFVLIFFVSLGTPGSANCDNIPYRYPSRVLTRKEPRNVRSLLDVSSDITASTTELARTAREIVNQAHWAYVAYTGSQGGVSYPFVSVKAVSDGGRGNGTGVPHFFLNPLESFTTDLAKNNRATFLFTSNRTFTCRRNPMDERCINVYLTGKVETIEKTDTEEYKNAEDAVRDRHHYLNRNMDNDNYALGKLNVESIVVAASSSGAFRVPLEKYQNP